MGEEGGGLVGPFPRLKASSSFFFGCYTSSLFVTMLVSRGLEGVRSKSGDERTLAIAAFGRSVCKNKGGKV